MIPNKTSGLSVLFKWESIVGVVFRETRIEGVNVCSNKSRTT